MILLLVVSVGFNYYLFQENKGFKKSIGSDYLLTVRLTLLELDTPENFWVAELQNDSGEMLLERYRIGLEEISKGYSRMNGKVGVLGDYLRVISRLYSELGKAITNENEENTKSIQEEIDNHQQFLNKVLVEIEKKFGEDLLLWYQELSNSESRTSNRIWDEITTFEKQKNS